MSNILKTFKIFKEGKMDPVSSSFCGAKWFEGTIWLYQGATASCHHNPFHSIELDPNDPSSLHNTSQKITERQAMLQGEQPTGCNYCWSIEREGGISDRVLKTISIPRARLQNLLNDMSLTVMPYMLEIAFERTCNLACAYCGPSFSSKWANEIKNKGPYTNLITDSRYETSLDDKMIDSGDNPYIDAFFKWWPELETHLTWMRITGGEPLMSSSFWKFLDLLNESNKFKGMLSINTNLITHKDEIDRLIIKTKNFNTKIHTSVESNFDSAEYVRDGFQRDIWLTNVYKILDNTFGVLNVTTSLNNMGVWSYIDYLQLMLELKTKYGGHRIETGCNFVHYPAFMRVQLIPIGLRQELVSEIQQWLATYDITSLFNVVEVEHIQRFLTIMETAPVELNETYWKTEYGLTDLQNFVQQYDVRRGKDYRVSLDPRFVKWISNE